MAIDDHTRAINPRWKSRRAIISNLKSRVTDQDDLDAEEIARYNERLPRPAGHIQNSNNAPPFFGYAAVAQRILNVAIRQALLNEPWLPEAERSTAYRMLSSRLGFYWHWRFRQLYPTHSTPMRVMDWLAMIETMGFSFAYGWVDDASYEGYLICKTLRKGYQNMLSYVEGHRRAQAFMLRLFCDWRGDVSYQWAPWAYEIPCYEVLLENWRVADPMSLVPALLSACDRHTFESHHDTSKKWYDFSDESMMRTPVEILMLFRLRKLLGLENPHLAHPLMEAPFDRLPDVQPTYPLDDRMVGTLKRVREDWPDFDQVTSLDAIRAD